MNDTNTNEEMKSSDVIHCESLSRGLAAGHFDLETYFQNITFSVVGCDLKSWRDCLNTIPSDLFLGYKEYLNVTVEQVDYKPDPWVFLFGGESFLEIEKKN